jgi:o-succinylbenzoate synthase
MKLLLKRFSGDSRGAQGARQTWPTRSGLLIELSHRSVRGLGEASPLPGYSPDTLEETEIALGAIDLARLEDALRIEETTAALKAVAHLVPAGLPAARMALETAALDLRGRQRKLSAPALLGAEAGTRRSLAYLLRASEGAAMSDALRAGYQHFKMKIGNVGNLASEIADVQVTRQQLGVGRRLRLDANRAWSRTEAKLACILLEPLDIEFIEEPCARPTAALGSSVPLALDESLQGLAVQDLDVLVKRTGATVVILKPMVLGGLSHCLELAGRAQSLGLGVVVSHTFDGPVALLAASALALALPTGAAQGLAPHAGLNAWPPADLPIREATLRAWSSPGLGLAAEHWP